MTHDDEAIQRRIGALVQGQREARRLSATGFARAAGVNFRTLKDLEAGESRPWPQTAAKIEEALRWKPGSLELLREQPDELDAAEADPTILLQRVDATVHAPAAAAVADVPTRGASLLREALITIVTERMSALPTEDLHRVTEMVDEIGRERYSDWDDRWQGDYDLAWGRRAKLRPLAPADEQAVLDSLDDVED